MNSSSKMKALGAAAIVFGALTVWSGARALFGSAQAVAAVGNAVPFVLWFNFLAGFAYIGTGVGILRQQAWARKAALALIAATALVAAAFAVHVVSGAAFEMRTAVALALRLAFWSVVAWQLWRMR